MQKAELVFVPLASVDHLIPAMEMAILVDHHEWLSVTFLIMKLPSDFKIVTISTESLVTSNLSNRIRYINLPNDESDLGLDPRSFFTTIFENRKPHVKEAVSKVVLSKSSGPANSPKPAGFVADMFSSCTIDVANESEVPRYLFYTFDAAYLGLTLHTQHSSL